ncbi:MAG TPA: hypothetical protein VFN45_15830 [Myxococcaceae bacterium]|nr:hypothetical protein [Myxococcaceae bacterium]
MAEPTRPRRRWYVRWWAWTLWAFLLVVVAFAIALQPIARYATRRALASVPGYVGSFDDAHVSIIPLEYRVTKLKLEPRDRSRPTVYAEDTVAGLDWKWLLRGKLRAAASVYKGNLVLREAKGKSSTEHVPDLSRIFKRITPGMLHRVQLRSSELTYIFRNEKDVEGKQQQAAEGRSTVPKLWIHDVEATIENLATRPELAEGATTFAMTAVLNKSGKTTLFATADPLAKGITFAGQMAIKGFDLKDAYNLVDSKSDIAFGKGRLDLLARFGCRSGELTGAVQPVIKDAEVKAAKEDFGTKVKAWAANLGVDLLSDRVPGRNAVSTVVPIEGDLSDPQIQLWPAIFGVFRNAFVQGIGASFSHLPPPRAEESQNVFEQANSALNRKAGLPKEQPRARR